MWQLISQPAPRSLALIPGAHLFDSCHMCAVIGSKCMAAHRSCMFLMGRRENILPFPVDLGEIVLVGHKDFTLKSWLTVKLWETSLHLFFRWLFHQTTCIVYAFCGVLFGLCSLSNLTALSCVCWLKVCCPNYGKSANTNSLKGDFNFLLIFSLKWKMKKDGF